MKLIIYAHPHQKSHSHKALETMVGKFEKEGVDYKVVDLYREKFQSHLEAEELEAMKSKGEMRKDVLEYQQLIKAADTLIFIYPVWWYGVPAILKGFLDRVFTNGFAYNFKRTNSLMMLGAWLISWIPGVRYLVQTHSARGHFGDKQAVIVRTYGGPSLGARMFGRTEYQLENGVLRFCGISKIKKVVLYGVDTSANTPEKEAEFYRKVGEIGG